MKSFVSFIIPVFNEEKRIGFCLERILKQCFCNIEIICIDDNSTDDSYKIVSYYAKLYENIKVFRNEKNMGAGYNRNLGLEKANGKYIWFVDADDYIEDDVLKELVELADENDLDVLCFDIKRIEDNNSQFVHSYLPIERTDVVEGQDLFCEISTKSRIRASVCCLLYRRQYLKDIVVRFREGVIAEDAYFSMKALIMAKRALYIRKVCYVYYKSLDSVTTKTSNEDNFVGFF